ncbi:MAG: nuclear transport factor 2 family protein [Saprospiraceae bacterium]|nr:nuclear transport factor 2 family protein [Saprospiraceae bacterium]
MKSITINLLLLVSTFTYTNSCFAQQDDQKTFEAYLSKVFNAYESSDVNAMWQYYTENASEITPDGRLSVGKESLKASWEEFMKMVDSRPKFSYKLTSWRLITPEVALLTWDSNADIKVQGQQMGGPSTCVAVLHKIDDNWQIEFDGMVPIMPMPAGN